MFVGTFRFSCKGFSFTSKDFFVCLSVLYDNWLAEPAEHYAPLGAHVLTLFRYKLFILC